jgi:hypothetical protein
MTAPAVIGLTYRGTDIQDPDGIFLELLRGLRERGEVRGTDRVVPNAAGQVPYNRVAHRRVIHLRGWVVGTGATDAARKSDFVANAAAYDALFDPTLDPGELVATLEDGSTATIDARTLPGDIWDHAGPVAAIVDVELESVDPDWVVT